MLTSSVHSVTKSVSARMGNVPMVLCGTLKFPMRSVTRMRLRIPTTPGNIAMCSGGNGGITSRLLSCAGKGTRLLVRTAMPTANCSICSMHASNATGHFTTAADGALRGSVCGVALSRGKSVASLLSGARGGRLMGRNGTVQLTLFARGGSCR